MTGHNVIEMFESINDEEATQMSVLFQRLRAGYLEWKKTGHLPSGELWMPEVVTYGK